MNVYVVQVQRDHEGDTLVGVYSTIAKAKAAGQAEALQLRFGFSNHVTEAQRESWLAARPWIRLPGSYAVMITVDKYADIVIQRWKVD